MWVCAGCGAEYKAVYLEWCPRCGETLSLSIVLAYECWWVAVDERDPDEMDTYAREVLGYVYDEGRGIYVHPDEAGAACLSRRS